MGIVPSCLMTGPSASEERGRERSEPDSTVPMCLMPAPRNEEAA
jgi:hypothetical protein